MDLYYKGIAESLETAALKHPDDIEIRRQLFGAWVRIDRYADAVRQFEEIVRIQSLVTEYHLAVIHQYCGNERIVDLQKAFSEAANGRAGNYVLWYGLGLAYHSANDLPHARQAFETGLEHNPAYAPLHYNLGAVCYQEGHVAESIQLHERALQLAPDLAEAHFALGCTLHGMRDDARAVKHLRRYVLINRFYLAKGVEYAKQLLQKIGRP
jgi:tetratricopeptide (TPR) repeat protein